MSNAPTPETEEAFITGEFNTQEKSMDFARRLERERDKALRELQEARNTNVNVRKERGARVMELEKELHEAREALSGRTVSCAQCNKSAKKLEAMRELLREIRDDEVNSQDEADKFLRDHEPSELSKMRDAIKEAHEALRAWPKAGHGMSTDHTLQSQAFRTGQAALAKLKPFLP